MLTGKKRGPKSSKVIDPHLKSTKFPRNPDPDLGRIVSLVTIALIETQKPFNKADGGEWARLEGVCEHTLKEIAKELGVSV